MKQAADIVIEPFKFEDDGSIPNHPSFPMLVYKNVLTPEDKPIDILAKNNWLGAWHGGVAPYHHYHSISHEVIVVASGSGLLLLGGEQGAEVNIGQGDTIILPAGFGHKRLEASVDFEVIGAYPNGQNFDFCYGYTDERPEKLENIKQVPLPDKDPLFGENGPLFTYWKE